ncbi:hypothetical protein TN91_24015 [Rhodococcus ruber]|nr:hypothetical protein TN91_24015 [Rhodococcus ruber]
MITGIHRLSGCGELDQAIGRCLRLPDTPQIEKPTDGIHMSTEREAMGETGLSIGPKKRRHMVEPVVGRQQICRFQSM